MPSLPPPRHDAPGPLTLKIITGDTHPDATTNARLLSDLGAGLVERGWSVELLAGTPAKNAADSPSPPGELNGVAIRRFWNPHVGNRGVLSRLVNSFVLSLGIFLHLLFSRKPDVLLVDTVSTFQGPAVWLASVLRGYRYVYLATELYPDAAVALGYLRPNGLMTRLWDWMNRRVYGRAKQVIVIGPRLREKVARHLKGGVEDPKSHVVHNWTDTSEIKPVEPAENWFRREHGLEGRLVVLYSGNAGLSHDVETLVEAATELRDDDRMVFVFIGGGAKKPLIEQMAAERGLENVVSLPFQPTEILPYSLSSGDLSVVTLQAGMEGLIVPSKLYPAMAAGQAILALAGPGSEVGDIVEEFGAGFRITQGDVAGLVSKLRELVEDPLSVAEMKKNSRDAAVRHFDRRLAIDAYESVLLEAVGYGDPESP